MSFLKRPSSPQSLIAFVTVLQLIFTQVKGLRSSGSEHPLGVVKEQAVGELMRLGGGTGLGYFALNKA